MTRERSFTVGTSFTSIARIKNFFDFKGSKKARMRECERSKHPNSLFPKFLDFQILRFLKLLAREEGRDKRAWGVRGGV